MPYSISIDSDLGLVLVKAEGVFTTHDLMESREQVQSDPRYRPGFNHLADLRQVTRFEPGTGDIRVRTQRDFGDRQLDDSLIAIVADNDYIFGMARIYESLMDGAPVTVRTFREMCAAHAWLGLPAEDTTAG